MPEEVGRLFAETAGSCPTWKAMPWPLPSAGLRRNFALGSPGWNAMVEICGVPESLVARTTHVDRPTKLLPRPTRAVTEKQRRVQRRLLANVSQLPPFSVAMAPWLQKAQPARPSASTTADVRCLGLGYTAILAEIDEVIKIRGTEFVGGNDTFLAGISLIAAITGGVCIFSQANCVADARGSAWSRCASLDGLSDLRNRITVRVALDAYPRQGEDQWIEFPQELEDTEHVFADGGVLVPFALADAIRSCAHPYLIVYVVVSSFDPKGLAQTGITGNHANALFIDLGRRNATLYDPHGFENATHRQRVVGRAVERVLFRAPPTAENATMITGNAEPSPPAARTEIASENGQSTSHDDDEGPSSESEAEDAATSQGSQEEEDADATALDSGEGAASEIVERESSDSDSAQASSDDDASGEKEEEGSVSGGGPVSARAERPARLSGLAVRWRARGRRRPKWQDVRGLLAGFAFFGPDSQTCRVLGLQSLQVYEEIFLPKRPGGFCVAWTLHHIHVSLLYPAVAPDEITRMATNFLLDASQRRAIPSLTHFIAAYSQLLLDGAIALVHLLDPDAPSTELDEDAVARVLPRMLAYAKLASISAEQRCLYLAGIAMRIFRPSLPIATGNPLVKRTRMRRPLVCNQLFLYQHLSDTDTQKDRDRARGAWLMRFSGDCSDLREEIRGRFGRSRRG